MKRSELRQDLVSGDWIVIAPGRKFHVLTANNKKKKKITGKAGCPFENSALKSEPIMALPAGADWKVKIIPNKYPAFVHRAVCPVRVEKGPFTVMDAVGHHDILITRDHHKNFPKLNKKERETVFEAMRDRYLTLFNDPCVSYVSIFHNWGEKAGASVYHPHYQIVGIPVIPPDVNHSLSGSTKYFKSRGKCVHCDIIKWEKRSRRLIYENAGAVAFAPFVSREPFEARVYPKKHLPYFENTPDGDLFFVAEALAAVLKKIEKRLKGPDYNFFIHTSPVEDKKKYFHYHWHIEVLPKVSVAAGFELGTGIEITVVGPEEAAAFLKK